MNLIGFSGSRDHCAEDLLDFAEEEDVVLLDFPELLVFSDFLGGVVGKEWIKVNEREEVFSDFWGGGVGKEWIKVNEREEERRTKVGLSAANGWTHEQKVDNNIDRPSR